MEEGVRELEGKTGRERKQCENDNCGWMIGRRRQERKDQGKGGDRE